MWASFCRVWAMLHGNKGTSIPQQLLCSWYSVSVLGPRWWKKLLFHCPCKTFCALVVLDHVINVRIYPAGGRSSLTGWWPRSLAALSWGSSSVGQAAGRRVVLVTPRGFFGWSSLWDPLHLQKTLCSPAHHCSVFGCSPHDRDGTPVTCVTNGCHTLGWLLWVPHCKATKPILGKMLSWAAKPQGFWDARSGIRFSLAGWTSVALHGNFCAPSCGVELPFGSAQLTQNWNPAAETVLTQELCQYKKMLAGEEGGREVWIC